jgi:DNA (cytosine-5)-methyltransferase 1
MRELQPHCQAVEVRRPLTGVDLFCGAGGMSLGFEQAGINVLAAADHSDLNIVTHSINLPDCESIVADLSRVSGEDFRRLASIRSRHIDVVFGGPPCQGFSIGGKRDPEDPRNSLIYEFARLVRELNSSYFVMENVYGLLGTDFEETLDSFIRRVKRAGYDVVTPIRLLETSRFGIPQKRSRVFILGYKRDLPAPSYPAEVEGRSTVWDAIGDFASVDSHPHCFAGDAYFGPLGKPSEYALRLRVTPNDENRRRALTGFLLTEHTPEVVERFARTKPGKPDPISRFLRLSKGGLSSTIRSGTGVENGSFMAPRPIHPTLPRCIYVREAARLHSFPDWYEFHPTKWHGYRQIGNSVPPLLARAVATEIVKALRMKG